MFSIKVEWEVACALSHTANQFTPEMDIVHIYRPDTTIHREANYTFVVFVTNSSILLSA